VLGRRLLVLFAVLLGLTALVTSLAPRPTVTRPGLAQRTPVPTATPTPERPATTSRRISKTISADPGRPRARIHARVGDVLALTVRGDVLDGVEVEAIGKLEPIEPGSRLPGGVLALYDGRGRNETPLWLPGPRALVFADALTERDGELRVWGTPWHEQRALPALRELLELPFEHVIVSHGAPVHDRAAYERALRLPPWEG
jgi:hypothetical protein